MSTITIASIANAIALEIARFSAELVEAQAELALCRDNVTEEGLQRNSAALERWEANAEYAESWAYELTCVLLDALQQEDVDIVISGLRSKGLTRLIK